MASKDKKKGREEEVEMQGDVPRAMVQQAEAAVSGEQAASDGAATERQNIGHDVPMQDDDLDAELPNHPPPAYGDHFGVIENVQQGLGTNARVADDGRVDINIDQRSRKFSDFFTPALRQQLAATHQEAAPPPAYIPPSLGGEPGIPPPPPMNVVVQVVGSRGDVQPFVALGKILKDTYGHNVRLATHPVFKDFVTENGLDFFNIGGDPSQLMAFMVKNPGLMPGFDSLRSGDVGSRRKEVGEYLKGCWRSCFETGDGLGPAATDHTVEDYSADDANVKPFVADCIIANPPSFAHIHCAEKMGIPLHIMFTMPYSPTAAFPHPLANIQSSNADPSITNYLSYALIDMLTWQGLGDVINRFRQKSLGLEPISLLWAPGMLQRLNVPHTYCWSPALIPKPKDWGQSINISGFFFLNLASNYTPAPDLKAFLDAGPPPVYIGFGSIVLDDPNAMTQLIFEAVRITGQRILLSKGWGGMGAEELGIPEGVFMLGNVPHDWLFNHVSCVVHHGGAGTTAAGITAGKPTVVVPFFGDQPFWGSMVARAGAGPDPLPHKELTGEKLAEAIEFCLKPESQEKAKALAASIAKEKGSHVGAQSFHQMLDVDKLRCTLAPSRVAVWRLRRTQIGLSAMAACTLANEGLLDFKDLKLTRPREYETEDGPWDPITGASTAVLGTTTQMMMGVADFPIETLKALKIHPETAKQKSAPKVKEGSSFSSKPSDDTATSASESKTDSTRQGSTRSDTVTSGVSTPDSSRAGSSFNLQESMDKVQQSLSPDQLHPLSGALSGEPKESAESDSQRSGSGTQDPPRTQRSGDLSEYIETAMGTGKGLHRIMGAAFKAPMDTTVALSKGFRNVPKLYGDDTVRKSEPVSDFRSGLRAAGKEFGFGMYDGITGLVTQPMKGAQKGGAAGLVKGIGKGIGGIMTKPAAAFWAIPGYTMKGIYRELQIHNGSSVQNYIIASRTAQGFAETQESSIEERKDIVMRWRIMQDQIKKKRNPDEIVKDALEEQRRNLRSGWDEKHTARARGSSTGAFKQSLKSPAYQDPESAMLAVGAQEGNLAHAKTTSDNDNVERAGFDEAIKRSVQETSKGNAEEDAEIERAIQASLADVRRQREEHMKQDHSGADDDQDLKRAMEASLFETQGHPDPLHDEELEHALARSLAEQRRQRSSDSEWDSEHTEDDEDFQQAMQASQNAAAAMASDGGHIAGTTQDEYQAQSAQQPSEKTQQEKTEEQVVLDYVKKQSMLEEQHRKATAGPSGTNQNDEDDEDMKKALKASMESQGQH